MRDTFDEIYRKQYRQLMIRGEERKRRCLEEEEYREGTYVSITYYGIPLSPVTSFKYLGIFLLVADNDCPEVVDSFRRAR